MFNIYSLATRFQKYILPFIIFLIILAFINTFFFLTQASNPLIRSDAWYFLDVNIQEWCNKGFHFADLFVKRTLSDHAQPLNKLFLYINFKYFDLDFRLEGVVGILGLLMSILFFSYSYFRKNSISEFVNITSALSFLMAILVITSLNSTELYTWSLVTFTFLTIFLSIISSWLIKCYLDTKSSYIALIVIALIMLIIGDTASIILLISIIITVLFYIIQTKQRSIPRAILGLIFICTFVATYFLIVNFKFLKFDTEENLEAVMMSKVNWTSVLTYFEIVRLIFCSSLIHVSHLAVLKSYEYVASWLIAFSVLYFYIRHFFLLFSKKTEVMQTFSFITTFILVYASIAIVAIIFGRLPLFGVDYLNQPRYVIFYQLIPFALLINHAFTRVESQTKVVRGIFFVAVIILLMFQLYFTALSYKSLSWLSKWEDKQAASIAEYALSPEIPAGQCTAHSEPICGMPVETRNKLINVLRENHLNIFNYEFQWRHKIFPFGDMPADIRVKRWGPQALNISTSVVGVWAELDFLPLNAKSKIEVKVDGEAIQNIVLGGNIVTFDLPKKYSSIPGLYTVEMSSNMWLSKTQVGILDVK